MRKLVPMSEINDEIRSARLKFAPFTTRHEGYAVIKEELDELWDCIKLNGSNANQRKEAMQIAAMAICYIEELL